MATGVETQLAEASAAAGSLKQRLAGLAHAEGFELVRFAGAGALAGPRAAAMAALNDGRLAGMRWMDEQWIERATDAGRFLDGAATVMVVAMPYAAPEPGTEQGGPPRGRVARYAAGRDYHRVFESRLRRLARHIRKQLGAQARATVDYGPLLERPWAAMSGLGWLGKSTMLLAPGFGPWVLLGVIATSLDVEPDEPLKKSCGSCARCITACPTGAISPGGQVLDARLCISYHTIENRGPIPRGLRPSFGDWVFGCDECLSSCPVGRAATASHPDFVPASVDSSRPVLAELLELDEAAFAERFRGRAIMRAKRDGLARNACVALGNTGSRDDLPSLYRALADESALVRGHAAWAIAEICLRLALPGDRAEEAVECLRRRLALESDSFVIDELLAALHSLAAGDAHGAGA